MSSEQETIVPEPETTRGPHLKKNFIITILVLALVSISYRLLMDSGYGKSSALYVGIPALLAIGLSFLPNPRTVTGTILLWTTLSMLAVGVLALEGLICILVALPFFLAIGFIVGIFIDRARARRDLTKTRLSLTVVLAFFSLEGTNKTLSFNRLDTVTIERAIPLSTEQLQEHLARGPVFDPTSLPVFLRAGFPLPQASEGGGNLEVGTQWTIPFDHGGPTPRNLIVEISKRSPNSLTLVPVQDETEIGKWLTWKSITWNWNQSAPETTDLELTFVYRRNLDPAFYFAPIQRFGVRQAGGYFLDSIINP